MAYLAGADVALSISMTAASTLLAPVATPSLLQLYAGAEVELLFADQALSIARIIVIPVLLGGLVRALLERSRRHQILGEALSILTSLSTLIIVLIVGCIVALNAERMTSYGVVLIAAVALLNA